MRLNLPKTFFATIALGLLSLSSPFALSQRPSDSGTARQNQPITKQALLRNLNKLALLPPRERTKGHIETINVIRIRGVDFELTPDIQTELRQAGAPPELIVAVRENFRSKVLQNTVRNQAGIEIDRKRTRLNSSH